MGIKTIIVVVEIMSLVTLIVMSYYNNINRNTQNNNIHIKMKYSVTVTLPHE